MRARGWLRAPGLCLLLGLLLAGCAAPATRTPAPEPGTPDAALREAVLAGEPFVGAGPMPPLPQADILGLDDTMRAFLAEHVDRRANPHLRLQQLIYAVVSPATFGLQYTDDTRTAAATFHGRNGNCLSFTNLFVALAREAGLRVSFQQVDIPPDWERRGDAFVLSRHVNVLVELGPNLKKAVDFNIEDFRASYDRETISDRRAQAHYYNNLGVERMQAGEHREAFLYLRKGLEVDPAFPPLWTNLGALYARAGHPDLAETAYRETLRLDPDEMVAISNLATSFERRGDAVRAAQYRELARMHREKNPYFRFGLAREAFLARDYRAARDHLDYAIRHKPHEDQFHFLRGIVRLQLGDLRGARADLEEAEALAADEALKRNYHGKMEMLLSDPAGDGGEGGPKKNGVR